MKTLLSLLVLCLAIHISQAVLYDVTVLKKGEMPAISIRKPKGKGYSPCTYTFNPAWINLRSNGTYLFLRAALCPAEFGGSNDHLLIAACSDRVGPLESPTCEDVQPLSFLPPFEAGTEDPRIFEFDNYFYMYYYAPGPGQQTVYLRRTQTPLIPSSWELVVGKLPWHRNGCVIVRDQLPHYVIFGESKPLPGLGIAMTHDFKTYEYINTSWIVPSTTPEQPEQVIEAATHPVRLSTGDYLHLYAAGTPGWVAHGNYTGGFVILDGNNPVNILQHSTHHIFVPTMDYEIGNGIWPVQRNRTIFTTSVIPIEGHVDMFRVWYGAADANVAWATIQVRKIGK